MTIPVLSTNPGAANIGTTTITAVTAVTQTPTPPANPAAVPVVAALVPPAPAVANNDTLLYVGLAVVAVIVILFIAK